MNKILVCDVDMVLVDSGTPWWDWMNEITGLNLPFPTTDEVHYDLRKYFLELVVEAYYRTTPELYEECNRELLQYWSSPTLYSDLKPLEGSVETLKAISEMGIDIVFCSYCKSGHLSGKHEWLEKWFPFVEMGVNGGFIATKEKHYLKADWVIEDRGDVLNKFSDNTKRIRYNTIYTQEEDDREGTVVLQSWDKLGEIL